MENDLPLPMPDRRIINTKDYYISIEDINKEESQNKLKTNISQFNELKESKLSVISNAQIKQTEDMRQKILFYKLLSDKTIYTNSLQSNNKVNKCNLIIFGPSGGGKTSFIKSLYRALYKTTLLPKNSINELIIRKKNNNQGPLLFSQFNLVKETENNSGIMICNTRGHLNEKVQNKIILDGKIKNGEIIEKIFNRDPNTLLEFWNKSNESFPKEIFKSKEGGGNIKSLPHSVILIFDGSTDEIIKEKDVKFYQDFIRISKIKGYKDIHVVLSKVDEFEKNIWEKYKYLPENEILSKINSLKDIKIERVITILGVNRSNVHFIENYHKENKNNNSIEIDYNILKTIINMLNTSETYILEKMSKNQNCFGFCF